MEIKRDCEEYFTGLLTDKVDRNVLIVEGARQVGKTWLIKSAIDRTRIQAISINLEEDKISNAKINMTREFRDFETLLESDYQFNPEKEQILFIDEAQESTCLGAYVRSMKEHWRNTKCVLTGSSMSRLFASDQRIPVGRFHRFKVNPFSFSEFLLANQKAQLREIISDPKHAPRISPLIHRELLVLMDKYLLVGGLPEVVIAYTQNRDFKRVRQQILYAQEDDFTRKAGLKKRDLFMQALRGVANHLGTPSKNTHIAENAYDARQILGAMRAWHLIQEVEMKGTNTSTKFHPKRYLYDVGIAQEVRNIPFPEIKILDSTNPVLRTQLGGLMENLILLSLQDHKMTTQPFSAWKKNSNEPLEVDFIWNEERAIPIECKASLKTPSNLAGLYTYLALSGLSLGVVISAAPLEVFRRNSVSIVNIPVYLSHPQMILEILKTVK